MKAALAALLLLSGSGCGTILHPERALVPKQERASIDPLMAVADGFLSIPFFLAGLASFGVLFQLPELLFPIWLDSHYGTLWRPKEEK
jgi:hypothetical protein